ncbi:MAG: diaminopimelate decarboxylase [Gammaproteobacteria bacterium]|nr:diaminopimelate decarboxylase [Gammaproteobacteria bacterium]MBT3722709.1 diaminopimelate decarboxylase [Gammaproteobacteria bacterium]MBT4195049.1 diaminopimelate decarboxylase [Gammaproteobacteria bacterium]MBT4452254.1 diaminopimelate decarboxylase [Gammaproteobacteria bacterium]MBT6457524.1 diaminopimelate decarboxylase [Gammaproteobacteria bacterium]
MDYFDYNNGQLHCEQVSFQTLAEQYGTPLYVYSRATLERHWHAFDSALSDHPHLVCYAVKANSNLAVLNVLARLGSGFDIVSKGELQRVLKAGGDPAKVIFSGVGKQVNEMQLALEVGIHCFNVESEQELETLNEVAADMNKTATISFRVNPDVDAKTHPYISTGLKENKFGISFDDAERIYLKASKMGNIVIKGIDFHIGSQLTELSPFVDAVDRLLALIKNLSDNGIKIEHMDLGGGIGVQYNDESPPLPAEWVTALKQRFDNFDGEIIVEPGRAIAGNAGILLTRVTVDKKTKHKNFAIIDAGMNDLMRPALYDAWQNIIPVKEESNVEPAVYDVVGPICETGDFLGKDRKLSIQPGDLLAIRTSGAYGFTMSSNYNSRGRAAEVMVDGDQHYLVRERETFEDLIHGESLLPE